VDDYFELLLYYPAAEFKVRLKSSYLVREPGPAIRLMVPGHFSEVQSRSAGAAAAQGRSARGG